MAQQLASGELNLMLHGKKIKGGFVLIHSGKRTTNPSQKNRWLLIKHGDEYADSSWDIGTQELDRSVLSGRLAESAAGRPN